MPVLGFFCRDLLRQFFFIVLLKFSTIPFPIAWYGAVADCLMSNNRYTSLIISEVNWDPLSEWIRYGNPTLLNIFNNASATVLVLISLSGTASGNLVHISIAVRIYRKPSDGGLIGPTMSTQMTENGVSTNGNLPSGAFETVPFDTFLWHIHE